LGKNGKITVEFLGIIVAGSKALLVQFYDAFQFAFDTLQ